MADFVPSMMDICESFVTNNSALSLRTFASACNCMTKKEIQILQSSLFHIHTPINWSRDRSLQPLLIKRLLSSLLRQFNRNSSIQDWYEFLMSASQTECPKTNRTVLRFVQAFIGISEWKLLELELGTLSLEKSLLYRSKDLTRPNRDIAGLRKLLDRKNKPKLIDSPVVIVSDAIFLLPPDFQGDCEVNVGGPIPGAQLTFDIICEGASRGLSVLVEGPVGCGKTTLLTYLAQKTGRRAPPHVVSIQLGQQMDSRALFGAYCCTEMPGEFVWKAGPITEAAKQGNWVILEDIDCAADDMISCLLLLLEHRQIDLPGMPPFPVHPQFTIFATCRTDSKLNRDPVQKYILQRFDVRVALNPFSKQELIRMISWDDRLSGISRALVECFNTIRESLTDKNVSRKIGPRDLVKWHARLIDCAPDDHLAIYREACDVLVRHILNIDTRQAILNLLANKLNVTQQQVDYYEKIHKPMLTVTPMNFEIGRCKMGRQDVNLPHRSESFSLTRSACQLVERIGVAVIHKEPILLVGETGCGKTSTVHFLADYIGHGLHVVNLSPQSETTDLLGGYKPMTVKLIMQPLKDNYLLLFKESFDINKNKKFLKHIQNCYAKEQWKELIQIMAHTANNAIAKNKMSEKWAKIKIELEKMKKVVNCDTESMPFGLVEGVLVRAIRNGEWILLDEINLAPSETLDCLYSLLDSLHRGDPVLLPFSSDPVPVHADFRLFACMNPATDVGKKDLVAAIRNRLTELFVEEVKDVDELTQLTETYLRGMSASAKVIESVVQLYVTLNKEASVLSSDSWGHHPQYSLRTFCRALSYASTNPYGNIKRSLYEAFCVSFMTELDLVSQHKVDNIIRKAIISQNPETCTTLINNPPVQRVNNSVLVENFWVETGDIPQGKPKEYLMTPSVRMNLRNLSRALAAKGFPILLQGETCVGKTSLIKYVAGLTGNKVVRINNHEHTDLQEYLGSYSSDEDGKLRFVEGPLVEAMRLGHWVILDELNLAPVDVLEALNRVLDDNREVFIPETQTTVQAHPRFQLLATQNPPGLYGGRKQLSRAFRNRFVQLNFSEFPEKELEDILGHRCGLPGSYSSKMVAVMRDLQIYRNSSGVFSGKESYMTLRDLFRWGERYSKAQTSDNFTDWQQYLADQGYLLLGGRCRREEDSEVVVNVLTKHFKRQIEIKHIFSLKSPYLYLKTDTLPSGFEHIVWTRNTVRIAVLLGQAIKFNEPCLLVGETGCGKTSLCELLSIQLGCAKMHCISCHLMSEAGDFLGRLRPSSIQQAEEGVLFRWCDGPLVSAMKQGEPMLIDEISLADDSVLERLNSVLEPERTLLLPELPDSVGHSRSITAAPGFQVMATMNPGGDFGKKELSRALRNRLTEVWCSSDFQKDDLVSIAQFNLHASLNSLPIADGMLKFVSWLTNHVDPRIKVTFTVRNLLSWVRFMNKSVDAMNVALSFVHGAFVVLLDSFGCSATVDRATITSTVSSCVTWLTQYSTHHLHCPLTPQQVTPTSHEVTVDNRFGLHPFYIQCGSLAPKMPHNYSFEGETCRANLVSVLRALSIGKSMLLEGPPGVGKSSLVMALAQASGNKVTRLNLSEQTELSDLVGTDVPVTLSNGEQAFTWCDGPLLTAMKEGHWILLDEMNLASQSVLEGLNACLDHRGELFIPEVGRSFKVNPAGTRFFACQNPYSQGGDRRGLPKSLINRFCPVYVKELTPEDELCILRKQENRVDDVTMKKMIEFCAKLRMELCVRRSFANVGGPWEFNLRDLLRWLEVMKMLKTDDPLSCIDLVYTNRFRTAEDKQQALNLAIEVFDRSAAIASVTLHVDPQYVNVGRGVMKRHTHSATSSAMGDSLMLNCQMRVAEHLLFCMSAGWVALLVGPSGCGKSTVANQVASLCGRRLHRVYLSSATDAAELVGCFEQVSMEQRIGAVRESLLNLLDQQMQHSPGQWPQCLQLRDQIARVTQPNELRELVETAAQLVHIPDEMRSIVERFETRCTFEWNHSSIVEAYIKGHWLLIENVNMCTASVLDRLNGALESCGQLTIPESGLHNTSIPIFSAHPDFRVIFTMDPRFGNISRAMRNRACEVCFADDQLWYNNPSDAVRVLNTGLSFDDAVELSNEFQLQRENNVQLNGHDLMGLAVVKRGNGEDACEEDLSLKSLCYDSVGALSMAQCRSTPSPLVHLMTSSPYSLRLKTAIDSEPGVAHMVTIWDEIYEANQQLHEFNLWDPRIYPTLSHVLPLEDGKREKINGLLNFMVYSLKMKDAQIKIEEGSVIDTARKYTKKEIDAKELGSPAVGLMVKINSRLKKVMCTTKPMNDEMLDRMLMGLWEVMMFVESCRLDLDSLQGQLVTLRTLWQSILPLLRSFNDDKLELLCATISDEWCVQSKDEKLYVENRHQASMCHPFSTETRFNQYVRCMQIVRQIQAANENQTPSADLRQELLDELGMVRNEGANIGEEGTNEWLRLMVCNVVAVMAPSMNQACSMVHSCGRVPTSLSLRMVSWEDNLGGVFSCLSWLNGLDLAHLIPNISWLRVRNVHVCMMPCVTYSVSDVLRQCHFGELHRIPMNKVAELRNSVSNTVDLMWKHPATLASAINIIRYHLVESGFLPLIMKLVAVEFDVNDSKMFNGSGYRDWMKLGMEWVKLVTPPLKMMDPVVKRLVQLKLMQNQLHNIQRDIDEFNEYNKNMTGDDFIHAHTQQHSHPFVNALIAKARQLNTEIEIVQAEGQDAYRPKLSQFDELCVDMHSVVQLTESLMSEGDKLNLQLHHARLNGWLQSAEHVATRLINNYPAYMDVISPFLLGLNMVMLGANQYLFCAVASQTNIPSTQADVIPELIAGNRDLCPIDSLINDESPLDKPAQYRLVKATLKHDQADPPKECINFISSLNHEIEELREKEQPLSYKYHLKKNAVEEEDEDTVDMDNIERNMLFPGIQQEEDDSVEPDAALYRNVVKTRMKLESQAANLMRLLITRVNSGSTCTPHVDGGMCDLYACGMQLVHKHQQAVMRLDEVPLLHTHINRLKGIERAMSVSDVPVSLDVYRDNCSAIGVPLVHKLDSLKQAANHLLQEWPEFGSLLQLIESCDRVMNLPVGTPVIQMSQALEDLLRESEEWEKVASRAVSLESCLTPLRSTLVQWRKQEVRCWEQLILTATKEHQDKLILQSLTIVEAALCNPDLDESSCETLRDSVMQWIIASDLGDFSVRLEVLQMVAHFLPRYHNSEAAQKLSTALSSIIQHFKQYSNIINTQLNDAKKDIEKELKGVVQVIKFQDLSLWSVKIMSQKAHAQLFRIVKKYREIMVRPAEAAFAHMFKAEEDLPKMVHWSPLPLVPGLSLGHRALGNQMNVHATNLLARLNHKSCVDIVYELTASAAEVNDELNKHIDYDKFNDNKDKEKLYRRHMNIRQTMVARLLKTLNENGFKYRQGMLVNEDELAARMIVDVAVMNNNAVIDKVRQCAANRCIVMAAAPKPHKQLSPRAAGVMTGLTQLVPSLVWDWLHECNESVSTYSNQLLPVLDTLRCMEKQLACGQGVVMQQEQATVTMKQVCEMDTSRRSAVSQLVSYLDCAPLSTSLDGATACVDSLNPAICQWSINCAPLICMRKEVASFDTAMTNNISTSGFITRKTIEEQLSLTSLVQSCAQILSQVKENVTLPLSGKLVQPHVARGIKYTSGLMEKLEELKTILNVEMRVDGKGEVETCVNAILLVIQRMVHKTESMSSDIQSVPASITAIVSLLCAAQSTQVVDAMRQLEKDILSGLTVEGIHLKAVVELGAMLADVVQYLHNLVDHCLMHVTSLYLTCTAVFHRLFTQGFMEPIPDVEDGPGGGGDGKLKDIEGGGIGEGEGNNDVSDQIEETGQVEGTKDEDKEDQAPPPPEEGDNPLDIEDDFDGLMQDINLDDKQGEDSDEDEDKKEEAEPDMQMGETDEPQEEQLDPNLWKQPEAEELGQDERGAQQETDNIVAQDQQDNTAKNDVQDNAEKEGDEPECEEKEEDNEAVDMENIDMRDATEADDEQEEEGADVNVKNEDDIEDADENEENGDEEEEMKKDEQCEEMQDIEECETNIEDRSEAQMTSQSKTGMGQNEEEPIDEKEESEQKEDNDAMKEDKEEQPESGDPTQQRGTKRTHEGEVGQSEEKETTQQESDPKNKRKKLSDKEKTLGDTSKSVKNEADIDDSDQKPDDTDGVQSNVYSHEKNAPDSMQDQVMDAASIEQAVAQKRLIEDEDGEADDKDNIDMQESKVDRKRGKYDDTMVEHENKENETLNEDMIDEDIKPDRLDSTIHTVPDFYHRALANQPNISDSGFADPVLKDSSEGRESWSHFRNRTDQLAAELSENLRLILEPSKSSKLEGDYRTGKRLNIRRLIPYIASHFRKDKIWLRRTKKANRDYRIMIAVDDSASMSDNKTREMALESVVLLCNSLKYMDAGKVAVCKFGSDSQLLHSFDSTLSDEAGASMMDGLKFEQKGTDIIELMRVATQYFNTSESTETGAVPSHLLLIVSDGRGLFSKGINTARRAVQNALQSKVFIFFIILDNPLHKDSILDIQVPLFSDPNAPPQIKSYMDFFPFPFYVILRKIESLPATAGDALRQWFELVMANSR